MTTNDTDRTEDQFYSPTFQTEVKNSILILIDSIVRAEEDFLTISDEKKYSDEYKKFRQAFRLCFILTKMRMSNDALIKKCNDFFIQQYPLDKTERTKLAKIGLTHAGEWIDHLSEEGVIDFYGGAIRKYNFEECEKLLKLADEPGLSETE